MSVVLTVLHVFVCIFENYAGQNKRRIGGLAEKAKSKEDLMEIVNVMSETLGIKITRSLEIVQALDIKTIID